MDTHLTETLQFEYPPPDSVDSKQTLDGSSHNSPPPQTLDCLLNSSAAPPDSNPDDHSDSALFGGVDSQKNEENDAFNSSHWSSMGWDSRGGTKTSASASASGWSDWPSVEDTKPSSLDWSDSMPLQEETVAKVSDSVSPDWSSEAKPAMVGAGLANLGNTCFLNAILQCFTHIVPLVQGLRSYNHPRPCDRDNEGFCVICTLRDHIEYSIASMDRVVSPWKLVDNLNYISSNFRRFQQEDAHEFLQCLLDRLDSCCIYSQTKDTSLPSADESLVKQVFGGRLISKLQCCNCGHSSDTYEPLIDLSLEIENVGTLPSALESFTKVEKIEDPETKFTCEQCKEKVSVEKQLILNQAPSVAAFHLKRFKNDGSYVEKIDKHVEFPLELDLLPYTGGDQNNDVELKYNLYAVVVHIGFSSTSGHYYCFIRSAPDAWYRLDDSKVTRVQEDFVLSQEAYILFYAKEGTPWFSSFMETEKSSIDPNLFSNSPQSVLDNVDRIGTSSPNVADNCSGEVNEAGEVAVGISVDSFNKRTHNSVEVDEAKDDSHRLFTPVPLVMSNSSSETAYKVERKFSPSALRDNNSNREFNKVAKNVNIIPSTPPSSPSPDIYAEEPPTVTYSIPRNHLISEKQVPCKRQLDKDLEDSERNLAHKLLKIMPNDRSAKLLDNGLEDSERKQARKLLKGMPNDRSAKLLAAMNGSHNEGRRSRRIESSSNRNERPSSARHNPNLSSFTRPVSAGSLRLSMNRRPHLLEKEARKRKKEMGSSSSGGGGKRTLAQDLIAVEESPGGLESTKNVVVVMDGLKEFTMDPLMWVLENIAHEAHCTITLLGVMPWLNIPLFSKTWSDIWTMDLEDLSAIKKKTKWKSDAKYQKIEQLINLCQQYGVKPQMRSEMGYPLQLLVVEQIISLHATLVVFDRHHQKYREYYAEKIPCSMVMMNEEGEVDMIKGKSHVENLENISEESPISSAPTTKLMIAERLRKIFLAKSSRKSCLKIRSTRSA